MSEIFLHGFLNKGCFLTNRFCFIYHFWKVIETRSPGISHYCNSHVDIYLKLTYLCMTMVSTSPKSFFLWRRSLLTASLSPFNMHLANGLLTILSSTSVLLLFIDTNRKPFAASWQWSLRGVNISNYTLLYWATWIRDKKIFFTIFKLVYCLKTIIFILKTVLMWAQPWH